MHDEIKLENDGTLFLKVNLFLQEPHIQSVFRLKPNDPDYLIFVRSIEDSLDRKIKLVPGGPTATYGMWNLIMGVALMDDARRISIRARVGNGEIENFQFLPGDWDYDRTLQILGPMEIGVERPVAKWAYAGTIKMDENRWLETWISSEYSYDSLVPHDKNRTIDPADPDYERKLIDIPDLVPGKIKLLPAKNFAHPNSWIPYR